MSFFQTPGVYYERLDASVPAITAVRTDIAGFVGIARRGPVDLPVPVQSWRQFQAYFGSFTGQGYLAYAVRAFFENGGRRCWVVRVASRELAGGAASAGITLPDTGNPGRDLWRIAAYSPGDWGNDVSVMIRETNRLQTVMDPKESRPLFSSVSTTNGFARGMMVRLSQASTPTVFKVISEVDHVKGRLLWINNRPEFRLPYDSPLTGFDPLQPVFIESVEYTLTVRESGRLIARYDALSLVPEHASYGPDLLPPLTIPRNFQSGQGIPAAPQPIVIEELNKIVPGSLETIHIPSREFMPLSGGADGLALLTTYDFIGEKVSPLDSDVLKKHKQRGLQAFDMVNAIPMVDEIAIVAIPDIHIQPIAVPERIIPEPELPDPCLPPEEEPVAVPVRRRTGGELPPVFSSDDIYRVQAALIQHCEDRRDRIAVLDPPYSISRDDELGIGEIRAWRSRFESKYAAFYYPWLRVVDPLRALSSSLVRDVPPSGYVAGQYARTDFESGVHKAPANAPLVWVQDVTNTVNEAVHGILNSRGINVFRSFPGRGIRIFGARTVSSDPDWKYVNVRRLMMMIEEAVELSIQWAVFEPNNFITRTKIQLSLSSFLLELWQQGALTGNTAEEAFFVKCDEENNPSRERDTGRLIADVGVAPSKPFEFIVLRVGCTANEFEIMESQVMKGGF